MTIRRLLTSSTLVVTLAAPALAQAPEPPLPPLPPLFELAEVPEAPEAAPLPPVPPLPALAPVVALAQAPEPPNPPPAPAPVPDARPRPRVFTGRFNGRINGPIDLEALYDQARQAIENSQYDRAIVDLDRVLAQVNEQIGKAAAEFNRADAAMYWKAYSQAHIADNQAALQTIQELAKEFANSTWVRDAKALAVEIQSANGQPISSDLQNDEELKLLALRSVMQSDPDRGVPIIEKMLSGGASPRVRDRALFVLSQSRSPRARDVMLNTAKNNNNPDLQRSAIRYLGMMGGADDREALSGIYRSATDVSVKRAILNSYMTSGNVDRMIDVAKTEKDPELRRIAIRNLGTMSRSNGASTSDALVSIYKSDNSSDIRKQIINSLFIQRNAKALVELARAEKDADLKRELVGKLSVMKTPEATDYMLELLK